MKVETPEYAWRNAEHSCANDYIVPEVIRQIRELYNGEPVRILDIGCGNGFVDSQLSELGHSVTGVDSSMSGISIARSAYPKVRFEIYSVYDDALMNAVEHPVDCVVSLEVVEHLFFPKILFEQSHLLLKSGGYLIVSTPYHGYLKNLAISLVNGWDRHFGVDWDGGHVKFFSKKSLVQMAHNAGFTNAYFSLVGRLPGIWKSMIMVVQK